jgi:hypothetical protein
MQQITNDEKAVRWVKMAIQDFLDEGRDRQEAVNEVLITCARIFGPETANYAEQNLGIKFVIPRPN